MSILHCVSQGEWQSLVIACFSRFNYELYFGFSWIFAFISLDRWIKVEWPTKSQAWCTRENYIYLCLLSLLGSLVQNLIYTFVCISDECGQKNLVCEIFIHLIYISLYMIVPIAIILISISRTCLITIHLRKRFRVSNSINQQQQQPLTDNSMSIKLDTIGRCSSLTGGTRLSSSFVSSHSSSMNPNAPSSSHSVQLSTRLAHLRRRRSRVDAQMVVLISINVAPFILVHIITEIAYLFEKYSAFVARSTFARLLIIFIYLSWYLISATRFYTNCLLSRIYREEFKNRLYLLRNGCKPQLTSVNRASSRRQSSKFCIAGSLVNGAESTTLNLNHMQWSSLLFSIFFMSFDVVCHASDRSFDDALLVIHPRIKSPGTSFHRHD